MQTSAAVGDVQLLEQASARRERRCFPYDDDDAQHDPLVGELGVVVAAQPGNDHYSQFAEPPPGASALRRAPGLRSADAAESDAAQSPQYRYPALTPHRAVFEFGERHRVHRTELAAARDEPRTWPYPRPRLA